MSATDLLRGIGIVLFITALAGAIAYVGDRVGHQIGRKRLTLFGIRPRYTSTIVAIATGMVIALAVTLGAIAMSQEVKLAFFQLNAINSQIEELRAKAANLEKKVNTGRLIINTNTPITPTLALIPRNAPPKHRLEIVARYFHDTVQFVDQRYAGKGGPLKPFVVPGDIAKRLGALANGLPMRADVTQGNVLLLAVADQNLYLHDQIHFGLTIIPDKLVYPARSPIQSLRIPASKNVNVQLAVAELEQLVAAQAAKDGLPPYFAIFVQPVQYLPSLAQMQAIVGKGTGKYIMTAFAAEDVYPHTAGVPVIVTLEPSPR